ncbi:putative B6 ABC transporter substrate-binding protein [Rathayibacter soli]|uniref:putative B6 ABC transporter substrate-binding protein n=1 Tax=Rathayibacter soli TaxID=3144168 RepID=UPI0027E48FC5|nr:BMP family ABC transporter substrate-binding protein [Glaciibacter superstes]
MSDTKFRGPAGHTFKRIVAFAGMAALVVGMAACSSRTSDSGSSSGATAKKFTQVAVVTPATEADHGWNQQGIAAAEGAAKQLNLKLDKNTNVGYDNTQTILTQVAKKGNDMVIAWASGFTTAAARASTATGVPMLVVDNPSAAIPGKVGVVTFEAQQGAYLAGIAAAMTTKTKTVGVVVSADDINWFNMSGGFIQGVRSVDPAVKIVIAYIGAASYDDSAGGKKVASQVIAAGADVVFGMGDGSTVGYIAAVESAPTPVKYIADIGDVTDLLKDPSTMLTSVRWNMQDSFVQAIKDAENGTFGKKPYTLTVANGGLTLQDTPQLTPEIKSAVDKAKQGIIDGSITVKTSTTKAAVTELLNQ